MLYTSHTLSQVNDGTGTFSAEADPFQLDGASAPVERTGFALWVDVTAQSLKLAHHRPALTDLAFELSCGTV